MELNLRAIQKAPTLYINSDREYTSKAYHIYQKRNRLPKKKPPVKIYIGTNQIKSQTGGFSMDDREIIRLEQFRQLKKEITGYFI